MKFTDGYWQHLPGVTVLHPRSVADVEVARRHAHRLHRDGPADHARRHAQPPARHRDVHVARWTT